MDELTIYREAACEAARRGAAVLAQWRAKFQVREKARADLVTDADLGSPKVLLRDLPWPNGVALAPDGRTLWFTEAWSHRVCRAAIESPRRDTRLHGVDGNRRTKSDHFGQHRLEPGALCFVVDGNRIAIRTARSEHGISARCR